MNFIQNIYFAKSRFVGINYLLEVGKRNKDSHRINIRLVRRTEGTFLRNSQSTGKHVAKSSKFLF